MSKSPFKIVGMSTNINLNRLGNFSFTPQTKRQQQSRLGVLALNAQKLGGSSINFGFGDLQGSLYNNTGTSSLQNSNSQIAPDLNTADQVVDQVTGSMPEPASSLINPFGLQAQGGIAGTFGSLFDRQNSMGSALAKRACKYKNKK